MNIIKQPNNIKFGRDSARDYEYSDKSLVITSKGATGRGWLEYTNLQNKMHYDDVEPNPSLDTAEKIISEFKNKDLECIIGLGGGSALDVAKFVGYKLQKKKILIPTTFGSGSEVTRISVLKINGKKKSFHDDGLFADVSIVDPKFIKNSDFTVIKNSAIDACAQCTEAFDSKLSNPYTKFLCNTAFEILENAILKKKYDNLALGSLITGLGFGNSSTTLGHGLSYVFSNEGFAHGHALAYTTQFAHKFNSSKYSSRFENLVNDLKFDKISLKQNFSDAADLILNDHKHIDNNPKPVKKEDIINILENINSI